MRSFWKRRNVVGNSKPSSHCCARPAARQLPPSSALARPAHLERRALPHGFVLGRGVARENEERVGVRDRRVLLATARALERAQREKFSARRASRARRGADAPPTRRAAPGDAR
jgi:hypothetical protein